MSNGHRAIRRAWVAGDDRHHEKLNESGSGVQLILICGQQREARRASQEFAHQEANRRDRFAQNVEHYMALADFFIGKPGPGSISEALQFHLPVIVECNSKTLPQERYNAQWVTEKGYGMVVPTFKQIAPACNVCSSARPSMNPPQDQRILERALSEVPLILEQCAKHTMPQRNLRLPFKAVASLRQSAKQRS